MYSQQKSVAARPSIAIIHSSKPMFTSKQHTASSCLVVYWKQVLDYHLYCLIFHTDLSSASLFREAYSFPSAKSSSNCILFPTVYCYYSNNLPTSISLTRYTIRQSYCKYKNGDKFFGSWRIYQSKNIIEKWRNQLSASSHQGSTVSPKQLLNANAVTVKNLLSQEVARQSGYNLASSFKKGLRSVVQSFNNFLYISGCWRQCHKMHKRNRFAIPRISDMLAYDNNVTHNIHAVHIRKQNKKLKNQLN